METPARSPPPPSSGQREGHLRLAGPVERGRVLVAAYLGAPEKKVTRLIDNMSLTEDVVAESLASVPS